MGNFCTKKFHLAKLFFYRGKISNECKIFDRKRRRGGKGEGRGGEGGDKNCENLKSTKFVANICLFFRVSKKLLTTICMFLAIISWNSFWINWKNFLWTPLFRIVRTVILCPKIFLLSSRISKSLNIVIVVVIFF